jgi:hypothetical protein
MESDKKPTMTTKLDTTQLAQLPIVELVALGLTVEQAEMLKAMPETQLSSMVPLALAAGKEKAREIQPLLPFNPEINVDGLRRCVYVDQDGCRCEEYGTKDIPVCRKHKAKAASLGTYFRSPKLRETYEAFANSPSKMKFDGELSLMRTMLASLLEKINDDNLNMEVIGAVTAMCEKITVATERMAKLEKITPEQLNVLMTRMVEVASKYVPADKLDEFAKDVEQIDLDKQDLKTVNGLPYAPGNNIGGAEIEGVAVDLGVMTQRKALLDVAQQMGVTTDG